MNILLDLDGTLAEPMRAISKSLLHACKTLGERIPTEDQLKQMIGPPLHVSIEQVLGISKKARIQEIIKVYREHHEKNCVADYSLYNGILEVLPLLAKENRLYLATSKPRAFAVPICEMHGAAPYFRALHGSELDGTRSDKGDLISYILQYERLNIEETVMVGDRKHDIIGAQKNQLPCLGVLWGYGSEEELTSHHAAGLCAHVRDLPQKILNLI